MNEFKFEDIQVGTHASFSVIIKKEMMDWFLQMSGDTNPLHVDEGYAIEAGFDGRVVYGLLSSSFYSTLVGVHLPGKYAVLHGVDISYSAPVYINDELKVSGEVIYVNELFKQIEIKATLTNQNNKKVSKAKIKVGFHI